MFRMGDGQVQEDILAVGYREARSPYTLNEVDDGLLLFWSLRNPDYPERKLHLPSGVTALDFSK